VARRHRVRDRRRLHAPHHARHDGRPPRAGWYSLDIARQEWTSAEAIADPRLWQLLELAREQVLAYAPSLAQDAPIPVRYRAAQLDQARNLLNAALVDPSNGSTAGDDFVLRPVPLDWMIRQQLRPRSVIPTVAG
jgi:hypothetical protein